MTSSSPIRVSILGTGSSLRTFHYPSVSQLPGKFILHSVLERTDRGVARAVCGSEIKVVNSLNAVLSDSEVDLVVIATPDNTHFEFAKAALIAGKHVLVEKPVCIHAADAIELNQLARARGRILSVYQNRRWDSDFLTVKKVISSGQLGALNEFTSCYDRYRPLPFDGDHCTSKYSQARGSSWKEDPSESHGAIYLLGSHLIDQAYILFGLPESLYCRVWDSRGNGVAECFDLQMTYAPRPGACGPFTCFIKSNNLSAVDPQLRFLVKGANGSFVKHGLDPQCDQIAAGVSMSASCFGKEDESRWGELVEGKAGDLEGEIVRRTTVPSERGAYLSVYESLFKAIKSGDRDLLLVKPEETIQVLKLIELALLSSEQGRTVTSLDLRLSA